MTTIGQKDIAEKTLESYNDVFADIVNVLLFNGRPVIEENKLDESAPRSAYKADEIIREQERDVAKYWRDGSNIHIALLGLENQTLIDKDMPLRILSYDAAAYRMQLSDKKTTFRFPVVTLVLYFGYKKRWDKSLNLLDCLEIPEDFKPYVSDYKINLFEIAYLEEEQVQMFQSDFRIVADYFVQMRKNRDYVPKPETIKHIQETLALLSVMTGDQRFETVYHSSDGGVKNMCEVLDRIEARGRAEGEAKGRAEGEAKGRAEGEARGRAEGEARGRAEGEQKGKLKVLISLVQKGLLSAENAAKEVNMTIEEFEKATDLQID